MIEGVITVKPQVFAAAVKWAAGFLDAKPSVPIHAGLKLEADAGTLTITAFSEYVSAVASLPYEGIGAGVAVVSGRLLKDLVATFPDKAVEIEGHGEQSVLLAAGRWKGSLPTMNEKDYPAVPDVPAGVGSVDGEAFAQAVAEVATAVSSDADKQAQWRAVHMTFTAGSVDLMGTDSNRAGGTSVPFRLDAELPGKSASVLVLGQQMEDVAAGFVGPDAITVGLSDTQIALSTRTRSVVMRTIALSDGGQEYPVAMVRRFLAYAPPQTAEVVARDLVVPLKRAALMRDKEGPVAVRFAPGLMEIISSAEARGGNEEVDVTYDGPEVTLHFNPQYFADGLAAAPGEKVLIGVDPEFHPNGAPKPVVLSVADQPFRYVVQPVRPLR
jgi:DNA polymerase III subunit beta